MDAKQNAIAVYPERRCVRDTATVGTMQKNSHLRRARMAAAPTEQISLQAVAERDDWTCGICLKPVPKTWPEDDRSQMPSLDHILPIARGGSHTWDNVQLAHYRCNLSKGARTVISYSG